MNDFRSLGRQRACILATQVFTFLIALVLLPLWVGASGNSAKMGLRERLGQVISRTAITKVAGRDRDVLSNFFTGREAQLWEGSNVPSTPAMVLTESGHVTTLPGEFHTISPLTTLHMHHANLDSTLAVWRDNGIGFTLVDQERPEIRARFSLLMKNPEPSFSISPNSGEKPDIVMGIPYDLARGVVTLNTEKKTSRKRDYHTTPLAKSIGLYDPQLDILPEGYSKGHLTMRSLYANSDTDGDSAFNLVPGLQLTNTDGGLWNSLEATLRKRIGQIAGKQQLIRFIQIPIYHRDISDPDTIWYGRNQHLRVPKELGFVAIFDDPKLAKRKKDAHQKISSEETIAAIVPNMLNGGESLPPLRDCLTSIRDVEDRSGISILGASQFLQYPTWLSAARKKVYDGPLVGK